MLCNRPKTGDVYVGRNTRLCCSSCWLWPGSAGAVYWTTWAWAQASHLSYTLSFVWGERCILLQQHRGPEGDDKENISRRYNNVELRFVPEMQWQKAERASENKQPDWLTGPQHTKPFWQCPESVDSLRCTSPANHTFLLFSFYSSGKSVSQLTRHWASQKPGYKKKKKYLSDKQSGLYYVLFFSLNCAQTKTKRENVFSVVFLFFLFKPSNYKLGNSVVNEHRFFWNTEMNNSDSKLDWSDQ